MDGTHSTTGEVLFPVAWIDVAKVDLAWLKSASYVSRGVGCAGNPEHYEQFGTWLARREPVQIASLDLIDETIEFNDGRHQFAWLRDRGAEIMPVHVTPDNLERVNSRFGVNINGLSHPKDSGINKNQVVVKRS